MLKICVLFPYQNDNVLYKYDTVSIKRIFLGFLFGPGFLAWACSSQGILPIIVKLEWFKKYFPIKKIAQLIRKTLQNYSFFILYIYIYIYIYIYRERERERERDLILLIQVFLFFKTK